MKRIFTDLVFIMIMACLALSCSLDSDSSSGAEVFFPFASPSSPQKFEVTSANPLKGFATWEEDSENGVPCSLEYVPIHFDEVLTAENTCNFSVVEKKLEKARKRRHQVILRFVIDEPNKDSPNSTLYLPSFLSDVPVYAYTTGKNSKTPYGRSPDYNNSKLFGQIQFFIKELAKKYDGDPRIANIETGLIGHWGEHHVYYCEQNGIKAANINEDTWKIFFKTFSEEFKKTHVSIRSPSRPDVYKYSNLGYYNDMVYSDDDDKYFREMLGTNTALPVRWKTAMVTGEFAPPLQVDFLSGCVKGSASYQKYKSRINEFHVSSLLCGKAFDKDYFSSKSEAARIFAASNALGYDFTVTGSTVNISGDELYVKVDIKNDGVAPFYYKWPVKIAVLVNGNIVQSFDAGWDITKIAPGTTLNCTFHTNAMADIGGAKILLGIPNPMENGYPVSFANANQDKDKKGWLTL